MKKLIIVIFVVCLPATVCANVVWPALYAETKINSVPLIGLSLLIEYYFFKWLFHLNYKEAAIYTLSANIASGVLGIFARPLSGILYELSLGMLINWFFSWGTFNPIAWIFVPIFGGAANAGIELGTLRFMCKEQINKKRLILTFCINSITVALATAWVFLQPPKM